MDKLMEEAAEVQRDYDAAKNTMKTLGPKRNKLVVRLSKKHTKAEIAKTLGVTSQRVIQILKKEIGQNGDSSDTQVAAD